MSGRDGFDYLYDRYVKGDAERELSFQAELEKASIASQIFELRKSRGLSQTDLAQLVGTTQSVISRLESSDYDAYNVETLRRIARALGCHLRIEFISQPDGPRSDADVPEAKPTHEEAHRM